MLSIFLFLLYILIFIWLIRRISFLKKTIFPTSYIVTIFVLKIIAGCAYGYIHLHSKYGMQTDTWRLFNESLNETNILLKSPKQFISHVFTNNYNSTKILQISGNNYLNDLKNNILLSIISICNIFSFKNYYINVILFNFINLFGIVAFIRFCEYQFLPKNKILILVSILIPSFIFWTSGIHKEGLLFTAIAFLLFSSYKIIKNNISFKYSLIFAISVLFLLFVRNYILLFLLPFLIVWICSNYFNIKNKLIFNIIISFLFVIFFFSIGKIIPELNLPKFASNKQNEFLNLGGATLIKTDSLQPTTKSYISHFPNALSNAFLEPSINNVTITYIPTCIENIGFICLLIFTIFYFHKNVKSKKTIYLFLFFGIFSLLFLGFTIPIIGAIIRYKSIFLPFLFISITQFIDSDRLKLPKK